MFPFNDCRRSVMLKNDMKCVTRTKCHPMKNTNGILNYFVCSTAGDLNDYSSNYGVCEESCPKGKD